MVNKLLGVHCADRIFQNKQLESDHEKDEICLQLKAYCKSSLCSWSGTLFEFLDHTEWCESQINLLPDYLKTKDNTFENVNSKEEI